MKMSFFWLICAAINAITALSDVIHNKVDVWTFVTIGALALSGWLYYGARKDEEREAAAKKQFINIVINHMGKESADDTAKRVAAELHHTLNKR